GEHMEMYVEPKGTVSTLHHADRAGERIVHTGQAEQLLRATFQRARELRSEGRRRFATQLSIVTQHCTHAPREGAHPMPDGHPGQHPLHEVHGRSAHAPPETPSAEPSPLAAKGNEHRVPALPTLELEAARL